MTFYRTLKPLLRVDSPLYTKRLVRELNALPDGFYVNGVRYSRARACFANVCPEIVLISPDKQLTKVSVFSNFTDAYGRAVHASKAPGR